jgi:hypothetical protein
MKKVSIFWNDKNESLSKLKGLVIPQNAEEFDVWAWLAHITSNYQMLH